MVNWINFVLWACKMYSSNSTRIFFPKWLNGIGVISWIIIRLRLQDLRNSYLELVGTKPVLYRRHVDEILYVTDENIDRKFR